jgi:ABC-type transport system involved in cytochrome c biogenesis permease subunit
LKPRIIVLAKASNIYWTERHTWKTKVIYGGCAEFSVYDAANVLGKRARRVWFGEISAWLTAALQLYN